MHRIGTGIRSACDESIVASACQCQQCFDFNRDEQSKGGQPFEESIKLQKTVATQIGIDRLQLRHHA